MPMDYETLDQAGAMMGTGGVIIADDHTVVIQGLQALLALEPDLEVVGEAIRRRDAAAERLRRLEELAAEAREQGKDAASARQILGDALALERLEDGVVHRAEAGQEGRQVVVEWPQQ